ncbi:hypothetical protein C7T94_14550 [Pedobacter yulinensis]|uniref:Outer membrane protein beta-barrel domain-containing protein n=1 Tax=Pedobacter yulinensis TaxID=2126353 RepID=A0A2T3HI02_9SPHI|nr:hypothetical protein [Pedobacter yulinensis]PST82033.1 hypothetical protein C7T94_14550 [Pedobacter yulinensis]
MKKNLLAIALLGMAFTAKSQHTSVEKSVFGIQTGFLGVWAHHEAKLSGQIALRSELGFDSDLWGGSFYEKTGFAMTPVLAAEPRWYYNLDRRARKAKLTDGNTGNYLSLKTRFNPDWLVISNYDDVIVISAIAVIPSWGIRRSIGKHFNYETGFGVGYAYSFSKQAGFEKNESLVEVDLQLRIGYRF